MFSILRSLCYGLIISSLCYWLVATFSSDKTPVVLHIYDARVLCPRRLEFCNLFSIIQIKDECGVSCQPVWGYDMLRLWTEAYLFHSFLMIFFTISLSCLVLDISMYGSVNTNFMILYGFVTIFQSCCFALRYLLNLTCRKESICFTNDAMMHFFLNLRDSSTCCSKDITTQYSLLMHVVVYEIIVVYFDP